MTDLQKYLLGLLKEIDQICRANDIAYYLTGGSLIGAVRHQGFIPWDDDVDIIMTRDNWSKFLACAPNCMPEGREIGCREKEISEALDIAHYVDVNTSFISKYHVTNPAPAGKWIDILILDPIPDSEEAVHAYRRAVTESAELINLYYHYAHRLGENTNFGRNYERSQKEGLQAVVEDLTRDAFHHTVSGSRYYTQRYAGAMPLWEIGDYGKPQYVPFEDTMLPVPEHAFNCLVTGYGADWMMLPQMEGDRTNHETLISSMTTPYRAVFSDFERRIDRKKMMQVFLARKHRWEETNDEKFRVETEYLQFAVEAVRCRYAERLEKNDPLQLLEQDRFDALREFFADYFSWQGDSRLIGSPKLAGWQQWYQRCNPVLIDLGDDALYAALCSLLHDERIGLCSRILAARKRLGRPMTVKLKQADRACCLVMQLRSLFYEKQYDRCRTLLEDAGADTSFRRAREKYTLLLQAQEVGAAGRTAAGTAEEEGTEALVRAGTDYLGRYPDDGELCSLLADLEIKAQRYDAAAERYETILETCRNGLVLLHMKQETVKLLQEGCSESGRWEQLLQRIRTASGEIIGAEEAGTAGADAPETDTPEEPQWVSALDDPTAALRFQLLKEMDQICRKNRIRYYLAGNALFQAVRTKQLVNRAAEISVYMKPEDARAFAKAVRKARQKNRFLQSMETDPDFHRFCLRYGDRNSLDYSVSRAGKYKYAGIFITVEILRFLPEGALQADKGSGKGYARYMQLEVAWEARNRLTDEPDEALRSDMEELARRKDHFWKRTAGWLYQNLIEQKDVKEGAELFRKPFGKAVKTYPAELFAETRNVTLAGVKFMTVSKPGALLAIEQGRKWKTKPVRDSEPDRFRRIIDPALPYETFRKHLKKEGLSEKKFQSCWRRMNVAFCTINKLTQEVDHYWNLMELSGSRCEMASYYLPKKETIMKLAAEEQYDQLSVEFEPYREAAVYFLNRDLPLYFDQELYEQFCISLEHDGRKKTLERLKALVQEQQPDTL